MVFYRQIMSQLDERTPWLRAVVQSLLGKPVEKMRDEEEELIIEKMSNTIKELDNLCDISEMEVDETKEEVLKVELTIPKKGSKSLLLRIAKSQKSGIKKLKKNLKNQLSKDKNKNLVAIIKLLQEELSDAEGMDTHE